MKKLIQSWRNRRLKKWSLQQAIKIHDFEDDIIKAADEFLVWIKSEQNIQQPNSMTLDIQKAIINHKDDIESLITRESLPTTYQ